MVIPELSIVVGGLSRHTKPKAILLQDAIAKRWRLGDQSQQEQGTTTSKVIPLLDGWIRRLEREAGADPAANQR